MGVYTYFGGCLSEIFDHNAMFDPISARTVPQRMLRLAKASDDFVSYKCRENVLETCMGCGVYTLVAYLKSLTMMRNSLHICNKLFIGKCSD
jgi:hypothetical protein